MTKTLTRTGNSLALIIERPILEMMGITEATPLRVELDGQTLKVSRADAADRRRFAAAKEKSFARYGAAYKRLAK
jgi:antitoxin MazE